MESKLHPFKFSTAVISIFSDYYHDFFTKKSSVAACLRHFYPGILKHQKFRAKSLTLRGPFILGEDCNPGSSSYLLPDPCVGIMFWISSNWMHATALAIIFTPWLMPLLCQGDGSPGYTPHFRLFSRVLKARTAQNSREPPVKLRWSLICHCHQLFMH